MIYLASPYSHPSPAVMHERAEEIAAVAARLMSGGMIVYCPIAAWHWVKERHDLPTDWESWKKLDTEFLRRSNGLWVCTMAGWEDSVGVTEEISIAKKIGLPISLIAPNGMTLTNQGT